MKVSIQLLSLFFSFLYGMAYYAGFRLFYKYLVFGKAFNKIIYNLFFMIFNFISYFLIMYLINDGYFHIYFIFLYIFGFVLSRRIYLYIKCQF